MSTVNILYLSREVLQIGGWCGYELAGSSIAANMFMERFEEGALLDAAVFQPRTWKRYVDDVFSIVLRSVVDRLLAHLNGVDENIRFTMEQEKDRCLPFLDVNVRREDDDSLRTGVFRKETHTDKVSRHLEHLLKGNFCQSLSQTNLHMLTSMTL